MADKLITMDDSLTADDETENEDSEKEWTYRDISSFYDRVRMALNAVSSQTLPDEYMDYPEKAPFAEKYIKSRVPQWAELDEEKFAIFESIIVYQTATMFQSLVASKHIRKKAIPTISLTYADTFDNMISGMSLEDMIEWLISQLNDEEESDAAFIGFRVTDGSKRHRGKCGCLNGRRELQ